MFSCLKKVEKNWVIYILKRRDDGSNLEFFDLCERFNWEPSSPLISDWPESPFNLYWVSLPLLHLIWPIFDKNLFTLSKRQELALVVTSLQLQIFGGVKRLQHHCYFNVSTFLMATIKHAPLTSSDQSFHIRLPTSFIYGHLLVRI